MISARFYKIGNTAILSLSILKILRQITTLNREKLASAYNAGKNKAGIGGRRLFPGLSLNYCPKVNYM